MGRPPKKEISPASNICLKIDDRLCFEKVSVAEKFNLFYTTVASKLVERLPESVNKFGKRFIIAIKGQYQTATLSPLCLKIKFLGISID